MWIVFGAQKTISIHDNIGTFGHHPLGRLKLLEGYLRGVLQRKDWDAMNKSKVIAHASAELDRVRKIKV